MRKCSSCKFCNSDYAWNDEDEYEIWSCDKGNDTDSEEECADYERYIARKPKEPSYECDWCKYVGECNNTIECTTRFDFHRHFVKGMGFCRKDSEVRDV